MWSRSKNYRKVHTQDSINVNDNRNYRVINNLARDI